MLGILPASITTTSGITETTTETTSIEAASAWQLNPNLILATVGGTTVILVVAITFANE